MSSFKRFLSLTRRFDHRVRLFIKLFLFFCATLIQSLSSIQAFAQSQPLRQNQLEKSGTSAPLTLEQALAEGIQNSPKIQKAKALSQEYAWKKTESLQGFLPTVSASASHLLNKQYLFVDINMGAGSQSIAQVIPSNQWTISASLPLFEGFSSTRRYQAASLMADSAQNEFEWTQFSLEREIKLKFYQSLAAVKLKEVAEQNVKTLEDHLKQTESLKKGGVITNYDVLRVDVQLNEAKSEVLKAEDDVILAQQRLNLAIGLDQKEISLVGELPAPDSKMTTAKSASELGSSSSAAALIATHEDQSRLTKKDLLALEQKVEASFKKEQAESSYWVPKLSLFGNWTSYNNKNDSIEDHDQYRWAYSVGLQLVWNIFDGMGSISRSQQAVYQRLQNENSLRSFQMQAQYDVSFWSRRLAYSRALYKAKLSDIEKAQESVRLAKEGFKAGTRTSTEVLDAELDLFRSRAGVVQAQINSLEALTNLELALGHEI